VSKDWQKLFDKLYDKYCERGHDPALAADKAARKADELLAKGETLEDLKTD
jgi:hypothetical protein